MNTTTFLQLVLPEQGIYFSATPYPSGGYRHRAFTDIQELATYSQELSEEGKNAFFSCASFKEERVWNEDKEKWHYRIASNASHCRAQWIDIDCGNEEYPTQADGLRALKDFCKRSEIVFPNLIVSSGNGLHAYWLFDRDIRAEAWSRTAGLFKNIMATLGFAQTDTSRTADVSSVLRPIGTNNDKSEKGKGIKPVKLVHQGGDPIAFSDWARTLVGVANRFHVAAPKERSEPKVTKNNDLMGGQEYPESLADKVADRCKQIRIFRDMAGANQTEPTWRACLGVVGFCEDGLEKAHQWSSGYESYDPDETLDKLNNWKANAGPTSCKHFMQVNPAGCEGCRHAGKLSSPIVLGRPDPEHTTEALVVVNEETGEQKVEHFPEFPESIKRRFRWDGDTLQALKTSEEGEEWIPFCTQLPVPEYVFFDSDDKSWKLHMRVRIRPFVWREADISCNALGKGGTTLLGELASKAGVMPRGIGSDLVNYMRTWAEEIQMASDEVAMHTHFGWYDDGSFLLGTTKYLPDGTTKEVRVSNALVKYAKDHTPTGDLKVYSELVNTAYNRPGHQVYQFTWLAGFASALLRVVHGTKVGIPLAGWSKESGFGKSTATFAAASIWGNPNAYGQAASANKITEYSLYVMAGLKRDLPVVIDETTLWEPKRIAQFAYNFSDGMPKVQGEAGGGLRDNSALEWSSFMLTSSNRSMHDDMISTIPDCAPQLARVWEYRYDVDHQQTMTRSEGLGVFTEMFKHYAVAGDAFLRYVVPNRDKIRDVALNAANKFAERAGLDKEARYWLLTAGCIWAAFAITKKLGMHSFDGNALSDWMVNRLKHMKSAAGEAHRDIADVFGQMLSDLQHGFIATDIEGDLRSNKHASFLPGYGIPRNEITGRVIAQSQRVYLSQGAVREWCSDRGVSFKELERHMYSKGYLLRHERYSLGKGTRVVSAQTNTLVLDWSAFSSHVNLVREEEKIHVAHA